MKKIRFIALAAIVAFGMSFTACDDGGKKDEKKEEKTEDVKNDAEEEVEDVEDVEVVETSGGQWSDIERDAFLESCMAGLEGNDMIDGESYCTCMLEKMEAAFESAIDAQNMSAEEMQEWAMDCM